MQVSSLAATFSAIVLLTGCVTTLTPPPIVASPQAPAPSTAPPSAQKSTQGADRIQPVYVLGTPPAGKGQPASATPAQMKAEMAKLAPNKAQPSDKAVFAKYGTFSSQRANNWMRNLDFSGVSWDQPRTATLISDRHVLMAAHYDRPKGATITFHDRNGQPVSRTLAAVINGTSQQLDISVGRLNQPVPNTVTFYPLPAQGDYSQSLLTVDTLATTATRQVQRYLVQAAYQSATLNLFRSGNSLRSGLDPSWSGQIIAGDSGNPDFILVSGQLVLVSTHTRGSAGTNGPFYGGPIVQPFVRNAINQLEQSFR